jgi:hypothetical protein
MQFHDLSQVIRAFEVFKAKAGCIHSQQRARAVWKSLLPYLTRKQIDRVCTEWSHFLIGEGREKLDTVCNEILKEIGAVINRDGKKEKGSSSET